MPRQMREGGPGLAQVRSGPCLSLSFSLPALTYPSPSLCLILYFSTAPLHMLGDRVGLAPTLRSLMPPPPGHTLEDGLLSV